MDDDIFKHVERISNHGSQQGIWPRFFMQMIELSDMAMGKKEFGERSIKYFQIVMPNLTHFYDLFHKTLNTIYDYQSGVQNGVYYKVDERDRSTLDRTIEVEINHLVSDFFIRGKILLVNFVKSNIIDEENFIFSQYFFGNEEKLEQKIKEYTHSTDGRYLPLLNLLKAANNSFLKSFNEIRGNIEHQQFLLDKFNLQQTNSGAFVIEPLLEDQILSDRLSYYYNSILDFIEKLIAYYIGINGEIIRKGMVELHTREDFDYSNLKYKYVFSIIGFHWAFPTSKCLYD